ncbi:MAG: hypothetical protein ACRBBR_04660 [Cellvibrionaceae bacterium]
MESKPILDKQSKDYLDFCYKEYVRLADMQEKQMQSVFSDIKLLGALGAMLSWKPILDSIGEGNEPVVLMLGFIVLMFIALFILLYDFMKQSILLFYTNQMKYYEAELRTKLDLAQGGIFSTVSNWQKWMVSIHDPIVKRFFSCFFSFLVIFPVVIILTSGKLESTYLYALIYFIITLILIGINVQCIYIITQKITRKLGEPY